MEMNDWNILQKESRFYNLTANHIEKKNIFEIYDTLKHLRKCNKTTKHVLTLPWLQD